MSVLARFLAAWPRRWQIAIPPNVDPAVALIDTLATNRTAHDAVVDLIFRGRYHEADSLLQHEMEPPLADQDRRDCLALLTQHRERNRERTEDELRRLRLRAQAAGGTVHLQLDGVLDLAELGVVEVQAVLDEIGEQVGAIEQRRREELEFQAANLGVRGRRLQSLRACFARRQWDTATRMLQAGPNQLPRAAPSPSGIDRPRDLTGLGPPLKLASELLEAPEALHEKYGLRIPDAHACALLRAVLATDSSPAEIAQHLDLMLGGDPPARWPEDDRFPLTSTEILPVPRAAFVGDGIVLAASGVAARPTDVVLDVGRGRGPVGPQLGLPEIMQVLTTDGDRRIALLRVLGPQYPALQLLDDLAGDLESSLDWAFDLGTFGAQSPLIEVLLDKASRRPALVKALFAAVLPDLGHRQRLVTDQDLDKALSDARTQEFLEASLLRDLDGDATAVRLLKALASVGTPDSDSEEALVTYAAEALEVVTDITPPVPEVEAAVARLLEQSYIATGPNGRFLFELGTVRALANGRGNVSAGSDTRSV